jgi:CHASE2 domain-containing sensor protein/signal transduction histidine kinase
VKQLARHWRDEITIAAVLAALATLIATGGWAWRLDRLVYDLGLSLWTRPAPQDIVIVAIDDASIDAIGRWPWRRAVHATLLEKIASARPRAIALDLVLTEPDPDPAQDRLLAQAIARAAPVVLPVAGAPPDPALRGGARLGAAEPSVDDDGVLRHAYLKSGLPGALYPHVAVALLQAGGERVHPKLRVETDADGLPGAFGQRDQRLLIRYTGPPGTMRRVSYVELLTGAVPASELSGKYVLIGMTAIGLGDTLATPVNGNHRAMAGVEVLANVLYTLKSGDTLQPLPERALALLSALALAALMLGFGFFGARVALPLALGSVPLAVLLSLLALRAGWWASPVPYALGALLAYPLWSWRRLERAVAGMDAEIRRLAAEPLVAAAETPLPRAQARDAIARRLHTLQSAGAVLRQARRFLAETVAAMPTAMLVADARGHVLLGNTRAAALFEVEDAAELQGLDLLRLLGEFKTGTPLDWPAALAALAPGSDGVAVEARGAAGGDFVVHVAAVELQGRRGLLVSVADVEPVKEAQREREEALAFVSHDLRAPASSIVLLADMQLKGSATHSPDELLREVRRLAARTLDLSEDFVRAAQAQTRPLQLQAVAVPALLEEALADHRAQAAAASVTLQLVANQAEVTLDRLLVARAIGNLVSNAIKHAPRDSRVEVSARRDATQFSVQVLDAGMGLSAAQMAQLTEGETGGEQGVAVRDARGVGLGLLFVQRVARRHGGRLRALPPPQGTGACFRLELPV